MTDAWKAAREKRAFLALENGAVFHGHSVGADKDLAGETVFNTGMTGYQEILSDPSYTGQFVCLTAPEIGVCGVNPEDMESRGFFAAGLVAHRVSDPSNWRAWETLPEALKRYGTPAIAGVDTRALAALVRDRGAMKSYLCVTGAVSEREAVELAKRWDGLDGQDYVSRVTCAEPHVWDADNRLTAAYPHRDAIFPPPEFRVAAYDFGVKWNTLRCLRRAGFEVTVVPARTPAEAVAALEPDGVFLSNGPADPAAVGYAAETIKKLLGRFPLFGICLGHQLLGMALGGKTYKLAFGHHGCNHPVKDVRANRTLVTSQNHNYALDPASLPEGAADVTHISLNDGSVEGLRCRDYPAFSVQYHPEAAPGPHDATDAFGLFRDLVAGRIR